MLRIFRSVQLVFPAFAVLFVGTDLLATPAWADAVAPASSAGNVAWMLSASALVLFMTLPGLAMFYGGLVRSRNVLSVFMHCFAIACVVSVIWALFGYSVAFSGNGLWLGDANRLLLRGLVSPMADNGLPEAAFAMFQMTFAIITPGLIIGAFVERVKFSFVLWFTSLWLVFAYLPIAHWVWGGGWLAQLGVLDFAGGIVVHTSAGLAAILTAIAMGPRHGFPRHIQPPHNPGMTMIGAGMLWFGWFGFNGGSALAANDVAASAILATHLAAVTAALAWAGAEWCTIGKPTSIGIVTGCVAGLATITPASGYVGPGGAIVIGLAAGLVCFSSTLFFKTRVKLDDSLDVFAVHGVGGMLGSLLLAPFAQPGLGGAGLPNGHDWLQQLGIQALAVTTVAAWSALVTLALVSILRATIGLRVSEEDEVEGLDLAAHGERAYDFT